MAYRSLKQTLWFDPEFRSLSPTAQYLLVMLRLQATNIIALYRPDWDNIRGLLRATDRNIEAALRMLSDKPWVLSENGFVWVVNGFRYELGDDNGVPKVPNVNHVRAVQNALGSLPKCQLVKQFCDYYLTLSYPDELRGVLEGYRKGINTPPDNPVPVPVLVRDSGSGSVTIPPENPADLPDNPPVKTRTFRERVVDGCLLAFERRYCKTRDVKEYPGGLAALREAGFGVVTKRLKTLCPAVPYRKADEAGKTEEELEAIGKAALKVWTGYLDRAAEIDGIARGIPGKDGDWLRFPASIGAFCGRIPKLTQADVNAAGKRAADVAEAKRNSKRMNPDTGSAVRCGELRKVIP